MLGKWASAGCSWANPCVHLPSAPSRSCLFSAAHQSMGGALLGPDLLSSGLGPVGQCKVSQWTLEVKTGDLSFILVNLSIKQFTGELHLLYDVTGKYFHMLSIMKQAWWRKQSFISESHERNKGSCCLHLWRHCQTLYIEVTFGTVWCYKHSIRHHRCS